MARTLEAVQPVTTDELKRKIDRGDTFVLIETLAQHEFRRMHLPGAVNAPPLRIRELAPVLAPDKDTEIVTYCAGPRCHASGNAARELVDLGYTKVRHYPGGKEDWTAARFPVETG